MKGIREIIAAHAARYPLMTAQDYVKLLYQSEFGPGHLVNAQDGQVLLRTSHEVIQAKKEGYSPAETAEDIGGGLCRFHFGKKVYQGDIPLVADCFSLSSSPRGSREGFWTKMGALAAMAWAGEIPLDPRELELYAALYDSQGCPMVSHSDAYRQAYTPHYRVMDADLGLFFPAFQAILRAAEKADGPILVAVDGRCASGKTTFAQRCAQVLPGCQVFHMDDFFLPFEKRTPERLSQPGGNVDYERAEEELFLPLSRGEDIELRPFDCTDGSFLPTQHIPAERINIVEGSYSHHPALAKYSQVKIFLTCSPQVQLERLSRRESPESLERFKTRWIPMEENYFTSLNIQKNSKVRVDTSDL